MNNESTINMTENTTNHKPKDLEPRVSALEAGLRMVTEEVRELAGIVRDNNKSMSENISRNSEETQNAIHALSEKFNTNTRTNWTAVIGFLSVIILFTTSIGGIAFAPLYLSSSYNKQFSEKNLDRIISIEKDIRNYIKDGSNVDATLTERFSRVDTDLENLKEKVDIQTQSRYTREDHDEYARLIEDRIKKIEKHMDCNYIP